MNGMFRIGDYEITLCYEFNEFRLYFYMPDRVNLACATSVLIVDTEKRREFHYRYEKSMACASLKLCFVDMPERIWQSPEWDTLHFSQRKWDTITRVDDGRYWVMWIPGSKTRPTEAQMAELYEQAPTWTALMELGELTI